MMGGQLSALDITHTINEQVERASRRHARIELAQAARGGIARIHVGLLAARGPLPH